MKIEIYSWVIPVVASVIIFAWGYFTTDTSGYVGDIFTPFVTLILLLLVWLIYFIIV